jgi:hypothetical protein
MKIENGLAGLYISVRPATAVIISIEKIMSTGVKNASMLKRINLLKNFTLSD